MLGPLPPDGIGVPQQPQFCDSPQQPCSTPRTAWTLLCRRRAAAPELEAAQQVLPAAPNPLRDSPDMAGSTRGGCTDVAAPRAVGSVAVAAVPRHVRPAGCFSRSILGPLGVTSYRAGMLLALFVLAPAGSFLHVSRLELGRSQWVYK